MFGLEFKVVNLHCGVEVVFVFFGQAWCPEPRTRWFLNALLLFASSRFGSLGAFCVASCPSVGYRLNGFRPSNRPFVCHTLVLWFGVHSWLTMYKAA